MLNADTCIRLEKTRTLDIPLIVVIVVQVLHQECAGMLRLPN